ncbi:MAG: hypothetical protein M3N12_04705 [Verrucomicrobiota bacterium]|nr:hypothetical protein [Verrucomicrobiota bacterium]
MLKANGSLVLDGCRLREILADSTHESARNAQTASSLREMMTELRINGGPVDCAPAAQSVFARFVKLPAVEEEKIELGKRPRPPGQLRLSSLCCAA